MQRQYMRAHMDESSFVKSVAGEKRVHSDHELLAEFVAGSDLHQLWLWEVQNYPDGSGILLECDLPRAVRRPDGRVYMSWDALAGFVVSPHTIESLGIIVDDTLFEQAVSSVRFADRVRKGVK